MKKTTSFRLLGLFLAMFAMSQPSHASEFLNWLSDFFNEYYNEREYGPQCYSQLNAEKGIGEGKVYAEWATQGREYSAEYVNPKLTTEINVTSPSDNTSRAGFGNTSTNHKYVFCASPEEGWEFEGVYTDEDFQDEYSPTDSQIQDGIYAGKVEIATTSSSTSSNHPVLNLYARFSLKVTLNKYGYSTLYYSAYNFEVPSGVEATTYKLDNDNLVVSTTYAAGDVIPAGEAVVLQGTANAECKFKPVKGEYSADSYNLLRGSDVAATTEGSGKFYALSAKGGKVGFYWMAEGGAAFTNGAHKAYLVLPSSGVKSYAFDEDDATAIMAVEGADEDGAIYNVAGQRLNKMQNGINIVNGKKILKK